MAPQSPNSDPKQESSSPVSGESKTPVPAPTCCRCRRVAKWLAGSIVLLLLLIFFAPYIASREPFRSWVLKKALPGIEGKIECADASFGWFSPLSLAGVQIGGPQNVAAGNTSGERAQPLIAVERIGGNKPLWRLLLDKHEPGDFDVDRPAVDVVVAEGGSNFDGVFVPRSRQSEKQREALAALTTGIKIRGGRFAVRGPRIPQGWSAGPFDAEFEIEKGVLSLEPLALFDRARLTPRACQDFLRFVAPVLAEVTSIDGEFSLKLDAWRIPLYEPKLAAGSGLLDIGSLNVEAGPLVAEIAKLLRLSPRILFVKDSPVKFYMKDERVHHVDLVFYIEGVQVRTQGSVGLDETLDMTVDVPMPKQLLGEGPLGAALAQQTLRIPVGGTLSQPKIDGKRLGGSLQSMLRGTVKSLADEDVAKEEGFLQGLIDRIPAEKPPGEKSAEKSADKPVDKKAEVESLIGDVIIGADKVLEDLRQRREKGEPTLLDQLRQRRQQRLKGSDVDAKK